MAEYQTDPDVHEQITRMKELLALFALCTVLLCGSVQLRAQSEKAWATDLSGSAILDGLKTKQNQELNDFLYFLDYTFDKSQLSNEQIDQIIKQLLVIQESDPYTVVASVKGQPERTYFPNRWSVDQCLFRFRFQKLANDLWQLPLEERVAKIVDGIEHPPAGFRYETQRAFMLELVRAGPDAVPFIVRYKPKQSYHRRALVEALEAIGDPRGVDYIIEVLKTPDDNFRFERPIAARALTKFNDKRVIAALVDALKDETHEDVPSSFPKRVTTLDLRSYLGRYFSVQHAAAESLTALTSKDWGLLFNEDYQTWSAWLRAERPETFIPAKVKRSDRETKRLVELMFHRYMSARPNPWQPQNVLDSADEIRNLATDLKQLGPRVEHLIANQYAVRVKDDPEWREQLRSWTKELLQALDSNNAREAAKSLR